MINVLKDILACSSRGVCNAHSPQSVVTFNLRACAGCQTLLSLPCCRDVIGNGKGRAAILKNKSKTRPSDVNINKVINEVTFINLYQANLFP